MPACQAFCREAVARALTRHQKFRLRTPSAPPSRQRLALWRANTPTVTTPGHWLTSVSKARGSLMARSCTSRIWQPLSVTTPGAAPRGHPAGQAAAELRGCHGDDLDRQRVAAQGRDELRFVCNAEELVGQVGDDLFACQGGTAALDHVAVVVDLVGAVDIERQALDGTGLRTA